MKTILQTKVNTQKINIGVNESIPVGLKREEHRVQKDIHQNTMKIVYPKKKFICISKDILKEAKVLNNINVLNRVVIKNVIGSNSQINLNKIKSTVSSEHVPDVNKDKSEMSSDCLKSVLENQSTPSDIDKTLRCIEIPPLKNINIVNQNQSNEIKLCVSKNSNQLNISNEKTNMKSIPIIKQPYQRDTMIITPTSDTTCFSPDNQQNVIKENKEVCNFIEKEKLSGCAGFEPIIPAPSMKLTVEKKLALIEPSVFIQNNSSINSNTLIHNEQFQSNDMKYKNMKKTKMNNLLNPLNDICEDLNIKLKKNLIPKIGHAATVSILLRFNQVRNLHSRKNLLNELYEYATKFDILQSMKKNADNSDKYMKTASTQIGEPIDFEYKRMLANTKETQTETNESEINDTCTSNHYQQENLVTNNKSEGLSFLDASFESLLNYIEYPSDIFGNKSVNISSNCMDSCNGQFYSTENICNIRNTNKSSGKVTPASKKNISYPESIESMHRNLFKLHIHKEWTICSLPDPDGYFPIHKMVLANNELLVKRQCLLLKSKNINVNVKTSQHNMLTPLHIAIENGSKLAIISTLLENKADPECQDVKGNTCLHYAVKCNYIDAMKKMLEMCNKIDLNIYNFDGYTPLLYSAILNRIEIVELLIKYGANINAQDQKSGRTSLFHAIENNFVQIFKLLLNSGADMKIKMMSGLTAWDAIHELSNVNTMIINKLIEHDSSPVHLKYTAERKKRNSQNSNINEVPIKKRKYVKKK